MKLRLVWSIMICMPLLLLAQEKGIQWTSGLTWQQVKEKAKKENKYIFVDCFTTWCKPCREMDTKVYTIDSVGEFLNKGFISVKLQMDETKNDNADIKSWYKTANEMGAKYRIAAYPSYIFFAPNGEAVSKEIGYKDPATFIQVARNAMDPSKQYLVLLKKYKQGQLDHAGTVSLIKMAQRIGDTADYRSLLSSYYAYLHKQKKEKLYTKENIEFVASTLDRSSHVLFDMFYPDGKEVNKVMHSEWYAKKQVDKIIVREIIAPYLGAKGDIGTIQTLAQLILAYASQKTLEPDWNALHQRIAKAYKGDYADRDVMEAKTWWFYAQQDFAKAAPILSDKLEKFGPDTSSPGDDFILNNWANWIWQHVGTSEKLTGDTIAELNRVCKWMEGVVRRAEKDTTFYHTDDWHKYMDTYANLLHKAGRTAEAIKWEEQAISTCRELDPESKGDIAQYEARLDKMKRGEVTWPVEGKQ